MSIRIRHVAMVLLLPVSATVTGCRRDRSVDFDPSEPAHTTAPALQHSTHELTKDEVYYLGGPMQGRPPEGRFEAGTRVVVLERMDGYSRVRSAGGVTAWVANGGLRALPSNR